MYPRTASFFALSALLSALPAACIPPRGEARRDPETSRDAVDANSQDEFISMNPSEVLLPGPSSDDSSTAHASPFLSTPPIPQPHRETLRPPARPPVAMNYGVEILDESSRPLRTFYQSGRAYVLGTIGQRYRIHVTNKTSRRVEAVVAVDGLDAMDGETADYANKPGYLVPAYGDVTIDGFRTSANDVATFRFSSVRDSYAGRKGEDRNVGVIGVAFFSEYAPPPPPPVQMPKPTYDAPRSKSGGSAPSAPIHAEEAPAAAPASRASNTAESDSMPSRERAGLGTEFGESRESRISFVNFRRANPSRPSFVSAIRYNDREGLIALGIQVDPPPPRRLSELDLRETADPFPRNHYASPPPARGE